MQEKKSRSYLHKLILLEIIVFLVIGVWYFNRINQIQESSTRERLVDVVHGIESYFVNTVSVSESTLLQESKKINNLVEPSDREILDIISDFETNKYINDVVGWSALSWLPNQADSITIDSSLGIIKKPIKLDMKVRPYIALAREKNDTLFIGKPIIGSVSGKWRIPFGLGIKNVEGKFVGTLLGGFAIEMFRENIESTFKSSQHIDFTIFNKEGDIIVASEENTITKEDILNISKAIKENSRSTHTLDGPYENKTNYKQIVDKDIVVKRIGDMPFYALAIVKGPTGFSNLSETIRESLLDISVILFSTLLIILFIRMTLLNPIIQLSRNAQQMTLDNPKLDFKDYDSSELVVLSDALKKVVEQKFELSEANTRLEFLANKAQVASNAKSDFIRNLQHELRTPLNHILGAGEIISSHTNTKDENNEYINMILSSGRELLNQINKIIDLADYESGKVTLHESPVSIESLLESALSEVYPKINLKKIKVNKKIESGLPKINVDVDKFTKALICIIDNSIVFANTKSPEINIEAFISKSKVNIVISDNGIGIKDTDLEKITDSFQHAGNVLTKFHRGIGLGLTIVKSVIELHESELDVSSEEGKGTKVLIVVPKFRIVG